MASLPILLLLLSFTSAIATSSNYIISRTTEQQILATVPPAAVADGQNVQPFLTSISGMYAAYLRRIADSAGVPGGDACYVQIQQAYGGKSVWESDCTPVGAADTCDLAFSPMGLELFAGGHSLWDTAIDGDPERLSLDDGGELQIVGKGGVTVWKANGEPWTGQECGVAAPVAPPSTDVLTPVSPASSATPVSPPATPVGSGSKDVVYGDQPPTMPPADTTPDLPDQPRPMPPADTPDLPDQPPYLSPAPVGIAFGHKAPVPPVDTPPLAPPTGGGETSPGAPMPDIVTPPGEPGGVALPTTPAATPHGLPHLPFGASPAPLPDTLAPSAHGAGLPFGQGQQQGQQVFGQQQQQLLNGAGQPLVDSSGGWSRTGYSRMSVSLALTGLIAFSFGF